MDIFSSSQGSGLSLLESWEYVRLLEDWPLLYFVLSVYHLLFRSDGVSRETTTTDDEEMVTRKAKTELRCERIPSLVLYNRTMFNQINK
jgi:hypothetical protein